MYKPGQVERGTTKKQIQLVVATGLELGTSLLRIESANHSTTPPPPPPPPAPAPEMRREGLLRKSTAPAPVGAWSFARVPVGSTEIK